MDTADLAKSFRSAYAHHRAGKLDKAEALYKKVLKKAPGQPDVLNMLGLIALAKGNPDRAVQLISEAVKRAPSFPDTHSNLGNALLAAGKPLEAIESYRRAVSLAPKNPEPAYNLSVALRRVSRLAEAEAILQAAVKLKPEALDWRREWAGLLIEMERPAEAIAILNGLVRPNNPEDEMVRATAYYKSGDFTAAANSYTRVTALTADSVEGWDGLGLALRALGQFEDAELAFRQATALRPDRGETLRNLGLIGKLKGDPRDLEYLSDVIARHDIPPRDRIAAGFALGKLLDEAERYDEAFARFHVANESFLQDTNDSYDAAALAADVDRIVATPLDPPSGIDSDLPVFIVGMPRSGTSLVEQIAASHPLVHGAGELKEIGRIISAGSDQATAAAAHLARLKGFGAARVTDKMPDNIFFLGRIASLYPNARVVFCRRDRRDTALSCYFTLFASGNLFSYNLRDCAHRIALTDRLARHWQATLPLQMLTLDYEDIVADLEGQSRRLISFLDLAWDPACLNFYQTKRAVVTASSWQVRQPLYARSVGRWKHYAKYFDTSDGPT